MRKKIFKASMSPWGGVIYDPRDFIYAKLNPLVPKMLHANLKSIPDSSS